ncbi:hypothetical protein [Bacillus andreraoultii]|uniref:hypothetical protein n=1 Tax=Bacillus andreraoultii TaxID=1499685 RepID=UPI001111A5D8|nr:hypothetical protein [Bacillus andreraoultii]
MIKKRDNVIPLSDEILTNLTDESNLNNEESSQLLYAIQQLRGRVPHYLERASIALLDECLLGFLIKRGIYSSSRRMFTRIFNQKGHL